MRILLTEWSLQHPDKAGPGNPGNSEAKEVKFPGHSSFSPLPFGSQRAREPVHMSIQCRVEIIGWAGNYLVCGAKLFDAFSAQLPAVLLVLVLSVVGDEDSHIQVFDS